MLIPNYDKIVHIKYMNNLGGQTSFYHLSKDELTSFLKKNQQSPFLAAELFRQIYKNKKNNELSKKTWDLLSKHFTFHLPQISQTQRASDGTIKFLMKLCDGRSVETVLIPFFKRYTICLSSQVGCAMNCSFCFTGTQGLSRNLRADEIIGQYMVAKSYLKNEISSIAINPNIVFMGQGEPLHNFEEIKKSIEIFIDQEGLGLGPRQMTLSSAGFLPGLKKFNHLPKINLAISLHSPFNHIRNKLIPINEHYPLEDLFQLLDSLDLMKRQYITYEYLLIEGLNDRHEDAEELFRLLGKRKAIINLIAFNPFPGSHYQRPSTSKVELFKAMLVKNKLRVMVRTTKGSDILAACGQLKSSR